ncbi:MULTISPECIES: peptide deformylase [unclassified Sedimentibacter]|uniref:peptide deformylase n=1 Tax=unclassified Sedimentibacter TaxID=2649220 RepID=UPI0027E1E26C|nr:peptide deformylase [Sedimentibacter sp. MB35-C1]WMJ75979.1 peptide deformylase [Sedimentibacter sp. MB35-C1]
MKKEILLLGNPKLYEVSTPVEKSELPNLSLIIQDLHDTLIAFRNQYNAGRAIAAPQIGVQKRILYMYIEEPTVFINPVLEPIGEEQMEVMDDCMSFPNLLVKVKRHQKCLIKYRDMEWNERKIVLEGDLSELLQHEYDHLDGILATMRAIDNRSFFIKQ